jgi:pilus assembly protein TadC
MWSITFLLGAAGGLGIALLIAEFAPRQPKFAAALERLGSVEASTSTGPATLEERLGSWGFRYLADLPGFRVPTRDLMILNRSPQQHFATKILLGLIGLLVPAIFAALFWVLGFSPFVIGISGLATIPLAAVMLVLGDVMVKQQAEEARQEFARAIAAYLELVAAERKRGASPSLALEEAATVGESWVFARIRQELLRAKFSGTQPWDALRELSTEIGVKELGEVADIMRLSGEEGAAVYESLRARGKGLRIQLLNQEHTIANQLSERMTYPTTILGVIFLAMIATPFALQLLEA